LSLPISVVALCALIVSACSSPARPYDKVDLCKHVIAASAEGAPINPVDRSALSDFPSSVDEALREASAQTKTRESIDNNVDCGFAGHKHQGTRRVRKLLVHVHGGLNGDNASLRRAADTLVRIDRERGADWYYPFFLTWPSGGLDSVGEHLTRLRFGSHWPGWLAWPTAPLVAAYDLLQGAARSPATLLSMVTNDAQAAAEVAFGKTFLPTWARARERGSVVAHPPVSEPVHRANCAEGFRVHLGAYSRGFWAHAWLTTRYVILFPIKAVTTTLFVDGVGKDAWRVMLHRAANTLRPTAEFENDVLDSSPRRDERADLRAPATGAFASFFEKLDKFVSEATGRDSAVCWEITLIGHSMGAIIINDALQLHPQLPVRNIVYMAPACSISEAEEALVPYLQRHARTELFVLTLHPLADAGEVVSWDLPARGSLLEWIDQWFQSPDHPLDRRLGKWNNALGALHVFAPVRERVTLKGFALNGDSLPQKHGDFNDCPFWRREFWDSNGPDEF
jgi:hypothetical protein